jgi:aminomethyltransferase
MSPTGGPVPLPTPLHALHVSLGARVVPFAGYALPIQYRDGIIAEHLHTRRAAGLFDVSHMGQIFVTGPDAAASLETLLPTDVIGLAPGRQRYTFLTNDSGGLRDDLMIANLGERFLLVVNAAGKAADLAHLQSRLPADCTATLAGDRALLALQGPAAAGVVARLAPALAMLPFMSITTARLGGADCIVSRSGYTGEDGFEIGVAATDAETLARTLLEQKEVAPVGLGARDSLRLEAGLCLYGQDIDTTTSPVEADLVWAIPSVRRPGGARAGGYPGADVIARQLTEGPARRRVGLAPESRIPVRTGTALESLDGQPVGTVTSGGFGPSLNGPVAMGQVQSDQAAPGTRLNAVVRGRPVPVLIAALPFVPHRYRRRPPA